MFLGKFNRYLLFEVLKLFAFAVVALTMLIAVVLVGQELLAKGLGYLAIAKLAPFTFLIALQYSVPATLLFSVCCVYGRISADNEIVALKSAGLSPFRIIYPVLALGLIISIPSVWLNDMAMSWGKPGIDRVVLRSVEEVVYSMLRTHRSYTTAQGLSIHVQDVEDRWLVQPTIIIFNETTGKPMTISAERAKISIDAEKDQLIIELKNSHGEINNEQSTRFRIPGVERIPLPLTQASKTGQYVSPSQFSIGQIPAELSKQAEQNDRRGEQLACEFAMGLVSGRFESLDNQRIKTLQAELNETQKRLARLKLEPQRRLAQGFTCLFFVWMGVPLSILIRSADYWWTFGLCFIPILLTYYPLFGLALDRVKDGSWPAISLWLGNAALLFIGTYLMRKVIYR